jgi:hypothetical protein
MKNVGWSAFCTNCAKMFNTGIKLEETLKISKSLAAPLLVLIY